MSKAIADHGLIDMYVRMGLLWILNNTPLPRQQNDINATTIRGSSSDGERTLTLDNENRLTQAWAFLCSYSDEPSHVMAACMEDRPAPPSILVRVAANSGDHAQLLAGLNTICEILRDEATQSDRHRNEERMLRVVVTIHRKRILARIRSKHSKSKKVGKGPKKRTPLHQLLSPVIGMLDCLSSVMTGDPASLERMATDVVNQLNEIEELRPADVESQDASPRFVQLVRSIALLHHTHTCDLDKLQVIPGGWEQDRVQGLKDRLGKLSRYADACEELLRAARRYQRFSRISVSFLNRQTRGPRLGKSAAVTERIQTKKTSQLIKRVSLGKRVSVKQVVSELRSFLHCDVRTHAEMQLLTHYTSKTGSANRPRVIASGKSACYMCHLVLTKHKMFEHPGTHGKLYEQWRWPDEVKTIHGLVHGHSLNNAVSQELEAKLRQLLTSKTTPPRHQPCESIVSSKDTLPKSLEIVKADAPTQPGPILLADGRQGAARCVVVSFDDGIVPAIRFEHLEIHLDADRVLDTARSTSLTPLKARLVCQIEKVDAAQATQVFQDGYRIDVDDPTWVESRDVDSFYVSTIMVRRNIVVAIIIIVLFIVLTGVGVGIWFVTRNVTGGGRRSVASSRV
ncbi:hypothetical protein CAC42_2204 [Sphaceloma murrayae]|uniref:Uncharacterized protein n=1 Tax=Sphaceloma murrayae TaxID=2082308 RepID=A0A2K1QII6_9PEZI|nr:hypothetical protein CAC42_2204 [Sphaceloma murrayae]